MIDKSLRNTLIGCFVPFFLSLVLAMAIEWVTMDRRQSLLEQQQKADHELILQHNSDMSEIRDGMSDIKSRIIQLSDLKADRKFK
jgi:hypothetical protein